jgi:hypothetical protein
VTVFDLRCDGCGCLLAGPDDGTRFVYHPGDFFLKDDSGLLCRSCWAATVASLGERAKGRCSVCGSEVERARSLHVFPAGEPASWQLCREHAAEFLNGLRTVEPKLDPAGLTFAADWAR